MPVLAVYGSYYKRDLFDIMYLAVVLSTETILGFIWSDIVINASFASTKQTTLN
jgi:hypothetical protein